MADNPFTVDEEGLLPQAKEAVLRISPVITAARAAMWGFERYGAFSTDKEEQEKGREVLVGDLKRLEQYELGFRRDVRNTFTHLRQGAGSSGVAAKRRGILGQEAPDYVPTFANLQKEARGEIEIVRPETSYGNLMHAIGEITTGWPAAIPAAVDVGPVAVGVGLTTAAVTGVVTKNPVTTVRATAGVTKAVGVPSFIAQATGYDNKWS